MFALHLEMNRLRFKNFNSLASTVILYNLTNTLNYVRVTFRNELGVFSVVHDALSRLFMIHCIIFFLALLTYPCEYE